MKRLILVASAISSIVLILLLLKRNALVASTAILDPHRVNATAILGGITEPNASKDFRGGRLTAFLGGVSVDLRQADIFEKPAPHPCHRHPRRRRDIRPPTLERQERRPTHRGRCSRAKAPCPTPRRCRGFARQRPGPQHHRLRPAGRTPHQGLETHLPLTCL